MVKKNDIINKEDYPMVLNWDNYIDNLSRLNCKCDVCNNICTKTVIAISEQSRCLCVSCRNINNSRKGRLKLINKELYPMVLDWSEYKNTNQSKLPCKCEGCGHIVYKTINRLDRQKSCYCKSCGHSIKAKKTSLERYGVERPTQSNELRKKISNSHKNIPKEIKDKIKQQREKTNTERYGVKSVLQIKDIHNKGIESAKSKKSIQKRTETFIQRYGMKSSWITTQENRTPEQIEITSTKENFENYLKSFDKKLNRDNISFMLGFKHGGCIFPYIKKWDLYNYFDRFSSKGEIELTEYINSFGFNTQKKRFTWGEIDIYIPQLKIGFEFNGCFWHNDQYRYKDYHYDKVTNAQNEDIRLIHIWEHEWLHNQDQIKSYIKAQLGLCEHKIFARKCEVREIDYQTAKPLLEYHQQKATKAQVYLGLYHANELVLCMLFGKNTNNGNKPVAEWDVKREICKEGYSIVGGKSKVFKYFLEKYNPESVVSFVDRSKFTGKSYEIMGFKLSHIVPARYDWVYNNTFIFKKRSPNIYKEMKQLYDEDKVFRIYDSGRYCYIWEIKKPNN